MMKIRLTALLTAGILLLLSLASCQTGKTENETTEETQTTVEETTTETADPPPSTVLSIIEEVTDPAHTYRVTAKGEDGKTYGSDYSIVYPATYEKWEYDYAKNLRSYIRTATGLTLPLRTDDEFEDEPETLRTEQEILVGNTNRRDTYQKPEPFGKGYAVFTAGERLVFLGGSEYGMFSAMREFCRDHFGRNMEEEELERLKVPVLSVEKTYAKREYPSDKLFPNLTAKADDFTILFAGDPNDILLRRTAYRLQEMFRDSCGVTLPVTPGADPDPSPAAAQIVIVQDETLTLGNYRISIGGDPDTNTIRLTGNGYYAMIAAIRRFVTKSGYNYFPDLRPGAELTGNHLESLKKVEGAAAYAYEKAGDVRVMFSNLLFSGTGENAAQRNLARQLVYDAYRPDVVGCQECNFLIRNWASDAISGSGIVSVMEAIGYREAVDPVVPNNEALGETFTVNDPILGEVQYVGYGRDFGEAVSGYSFYTQYNMVPLFYRTETTECLDGAYYWYRNQIDAANTGNCSVNDCASKAMTWGRFKDKATEEEYIVISTHMCTRSNTVRALQAMEVIDYVDALVKKYDVPIIFGGDMNGKATGYNIQLFLGTMNLNDELGAGKLLTMTKDENCDRAYADVADYQTLKNPFLDLQSSGKLTDYCSSWQAGHDNPGWDETIGVMRPISTQTPSTGCGIDRIFAIHADGIEFKVFGTVIDELSVCTSDHYPIFTDFSFPKE